MDIEDNQSKLSVEICGICGQSLSKFLSLKNSLWKSASIGQHADNH